MPGAGAGLFQDMYNEVGRGAHQEVRPEQRLQGNEGVNDVDICRENLPEGGSGERS